MSYTMYTPLNVWLDPASVTDVVAYIQNYLSENTIYSEEEIEELIHDYLIAHPELIGGVQSVNGKTGTVVLSASDINTANNVTIESVLSSLSSQISSIASSVVTNTSNITSLTGRLSTAETDITKLKSAMEQIDDKETIKSKNLLDPSKFTVVGQYTANNSGATGNHTTNSGYISYSDLIEVDPSTDYVLSQNGIAITIVSLLMIDSTGTTYLGGGYNQNGGFTTTSETKYLRISIRKALYDVGNIMLAEESTASPYEPWFEPYDVGIREEVDTLIENNPAPSGQIVCWGDSLTYGSGSTSGNSYPAKLANLTGKTINVCAFPSDTSLEIAGMQGAIPMIVSPVTIPATGSTTITIYDAVKSDDIPFAFPSIDRNAGVNPVEIGGIKGNIDLSSTEYNTSTREFTFTRLEDGEATALTWYSPIKTRCSVDRAKDVQIIWVGTNGGWSNETELINQIKSMIEFQNLSVKKYLVVGLTTQTAELRATLERQMLFMFGGHYINARDYMATQAIYDEGLTPTAEDLEQMELGRVPASLRADATHFNNYGYDAIAKLIYKRGKMLGYWN